MSLFFGPFEIIKGDLSGLIRNSDKVVFEDNFKTVSSSSYDLYVGETLKPSLLITRQFISILQENVCVTPSL